MKEENEQYYNCYGDKVKLRRKIGEWVSEGLNDGYTIKDVLLEVEDVNTGVTYDVYESELTLWED